MGIKNQCLRQFRDKNIFRQQANLRADLVGCEVLKLVVGGRNWVCLKGVFLHCRVNRAWLSGTKSPRVSWNISLKPTSMNMRWLRRVFRGWVLPSSRGVGLVAVARVPVSPPGRVGRALVRVRVLTVRRWVRRADQIWTPRWAATKLLKKLVCYAWSLDSFSQLWILSFLTGVLWSNGLLTGHFEILRKEACLT